MAEKIRDRKIVVVNQAVNYLTIGICNAFHEKFEDVSLITGSIHAQGEELSPAIKVKWINKWVERPAKKKAISYLAAMWKMFWLLNTKYRKHEVFFVSVPPMAYLLNLLTFQRFSMIIWDVYPDTLKITGMKESHPVYRIWSFFNRLSFKKAYRLFTIGNRMAGLLSRYVDEKKLNVTPIWSIFQSNERIPKEQNRFIKEHQLENKFIVQYSGNIGLTHKVELMVDLAELLKDNDRVLFQIIGRGAKLPAIQKTVEERNLPNCQFLPFQSDEMFPYSLSAADLGVVILDDATSKGSVPSKSYNLMSYGIPSLYIAADDSELHDYAQRYNHARCFSGNQLDKAADFINRISQDENMKQQFADNTVAAAGHFKRNNADKIVELYLQ